VAAEEMAWRIAIAGGRGLQLASNINRRHVAQLSSGWLATEARDVCEADILRRDCRLPLSLTH